ncbi:probable aspartyl protease At4g16563 [Aristolochia californica]|uniref:probable aspartyl protease At4g16563 n=1 Tax=Aristolochia californica TaxID=171875 RepID=UPI0035DB9D4E
MVVGGYECMTHESKLADLFTGRSVLSSPPTNLSFLSTVLPVPGASVSCASPWFCFCSTSLMKVAAGFVLFSFLLFVILSLQLLYVSSSSVFLPLSHTLWNTQIAETPNLIKASSARSTARFRRHHDRQHREISLPLSSGSDYTISLSVGSHQMQPATLYMDTGSDLVWFPCHPFECILCEGKPKFTPYNLSSFPTVPCDSHFCSAAHSSLPSSDLCAIAKCSLDNIETSDCSSPCPPLYYAYGDGSIVANLHHESLLIPTSKPNSPYIRLRNFTFGCAHTALAEPIGVAGFGRGALSLPAQLSAFSRHLGSRFSYCLISHSFNSNRLHQPSPLILGRSETAIVEGEKFVFTPMLDNPKHPYFYSVGLEAVSVGRKRIPAPENMRTVNHKGDGGVVVDSGTTFTMLPPGIYAAVLDEFDNNMGGKYERTVATEEATGLGRCYFYGEKKKVTAPGVALHFAGNASVALPRRNYFTGFLRESGGRKRKVGCLMVMSGGDEADSGGPAATLGNFQQQGFEVVYDLERRRVGFARRQCASLWESLSRD